MLRRLHAAANDSIFRNMFICRIGKGIRQIKHVRRQRQPEWPRQPAMQEESAGLAIPTHVCAEIQKALFMKASKRERERIKPARPEMAHGHRDHAHAGLPIMQLQVKWRWNMW